MGDDLWEPLAFAMTFPFFLVIFFFLNVSIKNIPPPPQHHQKEKLNKSSIPLKNDIHHAGALCTHGAHILLYTCHKDLILAIHWVRLVFFFFFTEHMESFKNKLPHLIHSYLEIITPYITLMKLCCLL